jgi:hypothetical protein
MSIGSQKSEKIEQHSAMIESQAKPLMKNNGFMGGVRQWLAEHAPEDHDDRRTEQGEADHFQAVAHRRGVSHSDRWWRWRWFGSCFRAGAKRQGTTGGGQQQE